MTLTLGDGVVLEPLGDGAVRFALPRAAEPRATLEALRACVGIVDAVVCETHACVYFADDAPTTLATDLSKIVARLARGSTQRAFPTRVHVVRVRYDGPDLETLAAHANVMPRDVARLHAAREYDVRMIGFLAGFAYLREVDPKIAAPRRASPRARVDACAVGIAGGYTGIYPFACPGGWNVVGTALDFVAFDAARGALFELGDRVRFEIAT